MSGDMFSTLSENVDNCTEDIKYKFGRVNIYNTLEKCSYTEDCKWKHSIENKNSLCNICIHKKLFDIPMLINKKLEEKFGINKEIKIEIKCPTCNSTLLHERVDDGIIINKIKINGEVIELSNKSNGYDRIICSKNKNHVIPNHLKLKILNIIQ